MTNVVAFPYERRQQKIINEFEKLDNGIMDLSDDILTEILTILYEEGYSFNVDDYESDVCFVFESIRSLVCKLNNIEHPMHELSQDLFDIMNVAYEQAESQLELTF
jgi:hypothetical protein